MNTASSSYSQIVKTVQAMLAKHRYASKGIISRLLCHNNCGLIAFKKSSSSTKDAIRFTIDVGIVLGILMPPPLSERLKTCTILDAQSHKRIGFLMSVPRDVWWTVRDGQDCSDICREVLAAVEQWAVPFVEQFISPGAIAQLWSEGKSHGLTDVTRQEYLRLYLSSAAQDQRQK